MKSKQNSRILLYIIGIFTSFLFISPFYILIVNAFKTKRELFGSTLTLPKEWMLDNFKVALHKLSFLWVGKSFSIEGIFGSALFNSMFITISSTILIIIFSSMAAWILVRTKSKMSTIVFYMFIAAMLVPFQAVMLPLVAFMGRLGLQNRFGIIFMYLGFGSSFSIFLYHGFIKSIPVSLEEAARIDGCGPWKVFWKIIFPTLKPIHVTVSILNTIWIWNDFLLPQLMINKNGTQTIPLKMYLFFGGYSKQWHLAMAGLLIAVIPIIIFYFFAQKHIIEGVTAGSEK